MISMLNTDQARIALLDLMQRKSVFRGGFTLAHPLDSGAIEVTRHQELVAGISAP